MNDLLRNRLSEDLDSIAKIFLSSIEDDKEIMEEDILGTMAHDYMLYKKNILNLDEIKKILAALMKIKSALNEKKLDVDKSFEDIHPFIESLVINEIGIEIGGKIHSGRSRNDQVALDIKLKLRKEILDLGQLVIMLMNILLDRARIFIETPFFLYTHLQPAQLGTFGHVLLGWASELSRHEERIIQCYERTNLSPLGACAIGGTSFPIDRNIVVELLGFDGLMENSLDAISSRDVLIEHAFVIAGLSIFFSRISEDIILYSSHEFRYVDLPDKFCSVSSVLPQKKNPDTLELIRANAAQVTSALLSQLLLAKGTPSGYNRDFQECKPPLWDAYKRVKSATTLLARIINDMKVLDEKVMESIKRSNLMALDLAEYTCRSFGIPFRKAHELVGRMVNYLASRGKNLTDELTSQEKAELGELSEGSIHKNLMKNVDFVSHMKKIDWVEERISQGAPNKQSMEKMLFALNEKMIAYAKRFDAESTKITSAISSFLDKVQDMIEN